jgi:DHA2 family multidrug resistance protein
MYYTTTLNLNVDFWQLSRSRLLQAMWLPFLFIPLSASSLVGIPPARNGDASALLNLMRNLGGSIGVSFTTTLLAWRTQFHTERLGEHVTPYNGYGLGTALPALAARISVQAQMMTYLELFLILGLSAAIVAPLALLLPRLPKGATAAAH